MIENVSFECVPTVVFIVIIYFNAFYSFTASTANLIGENQGLDVIYELLPQYTTKQLHILKYVSTGFLLVTK